MTIDCHGLVSCPSQSSAHTGKGTVHCRQRGGSPRASSRLFHDFDPRTCAKFALHGKPHLALAAVDQALADVLNADVLHKITDLVIVHTGLRTSADTQHTARKSSSAAIWSCKLDGVEFYLSERAQLQGKLDISIRELMRPGFSPETRKIRFKQMEDKGMPDEEHGRRAPDTSLEWPGKMWMMVLTSPWVMLPWLEDGHTRESG